MKTVADPSGLKMKSDGSRGVTWRPIPRAPAYEASIRGQIRRIGKRRPLKPRQTPKGYRIVDVRADGRPKRTVMVHPLVADAWIGPRPAGFQIDHADTNKGNNAPGNLEYVTDDENIRRRELARRARSA